MGFTDQKLKYTIDVDSAKATAELGSFDNAVGKVGQSITGGLTGALGSLAGPAGIAAGALTAVSGAAIVVGKELFDLTNRAAEYGSNIYDASTKTGLHAKTLSALNIAAKQSNTSMDDVTSAIAKFNKTVGAANEGSKEAIKSLEAFGLTPKEAANDLEGALDKVFQKINNASTAAERASLGNKVFGKSYANMLPLIDQVGGKLSETTEHFEKLGLTISDKDAKAADDFGDQMGLLGAQLEMAGIKIGTQLIPVFMRWATIASDFFSRNQGEIMIWATGIAKAVEFVGSTIKSNIEALIAFGRIAEGIATRDWVLVNQGIASMSGAISAQRQAGADLFTPNSQLGPKFAGGGAHARATVSDDPTKSRTGRGGGRISKPEKDNSDQIYQQNLRALQAANSREIAEMQAKNELLGELDQYRLKQGIITEEQLMQNRQQLTVAFLAFKAGHLQLELDLVKGHKDDELRVQSELNIASIAMETETAKQKNENADAFDKKILKQVESFGKLINNMDQAHEEMVRLRDDLAGVYEGIDGTGTGKGDSFLDLFFSKTGMDVFQTNAEIMKGTLNDLADIFSSAFMSMTDAVGQAIEGWILYGDSVGEALKKATAATLAQIAAQAAVKAIFYTAEGIAALFLDPPAAAGFFGAAALMASIAVGSGLAAHAIAGDSFKKGSKSSGGSSAHNNIDKNPTPYTRSSNDAYVSGRREDNHTLFVAQAIDRLNAKLDAMSPGDVLTTGMREKRGVIGKQVVQDLRSNGTLGLALRKVSGGR